MKIDKKYRNLLGGIAIILSLVSSCIPICASRTIAIFTNRTNDTLFIGASHYDTIDSVDVFLEASNDTAFYGFTSIDESGHLNIHGNLILPDSIGRTTYSSLFNHNHTGYLFIIKLSNARKYTWVDICKHKLYDIKVVTADDELQNNNKIIEVYSSK